MKNNKILFSIFLVIGLVFTSCSNDNTVVDTTAPKVFIQSPILLLAYSTDLGNSNVPYRVTLKAYGADETKISTLKLIVTNSDGTIVFEKTRGSDVGSIQILDITEGFETTNAGTYKAVFIATDTGGNMTTESVNFTYED